MDFMKTIIFSILLITFAAYAQNNNTAQYDSVLAKKLGANDIGMKNYVMALLKRGPVKIEDKEKRAEIQKAHLKNIIHLADEGKLIIAGPFMDDTPLRGIFIFNVESVEEARKLTETDPAIKAGVLEMELHPWFGSAALIETVRIHKTIQKKNIADEQ
jgi:uncharacterized protein YciI